MFSEVGHYCATRVKRGHNVCFTRDGRRCVITLRFGLNTPSRAVKWKNGHIRLVSIASASLPLNHTPRVRVRSFSRALAEDDPGMTPGFVLTRGAHIDYRDYRSAMLRT
jgi:hypothetical protein